MEAARHIEIKEATECTRDELKKIGRKGISTGFGMCLSNFQAWLKWPGTRPSVVCSFATTDFGANCKRTNGA
jgi:hypothetical protein